MSELEKLADAYKRERQRINRLELSGALQREKLRKAKVRQQLTLGELLIKSGLSNLGETTLLGLLLEAKKTLDDPVLYPQYQQAGEKFKEPKTKPN